CTRAARVGYGNSRRTSTSSPATGTFEVEPPRPACPGRVGMRFLAAVVLLGGLGAAYSAEPLPKHGTLRDPWDPTGIDGTCRFQYIPGVEGAAIPPPQPCPGAVIRVFWPKEEKPVAEAKADETGRFRIKLEPGTYRVEGVPPQMR